MASKTKNDLLLVLNNHPKIGSQTIKKILNAFNDDMQSFWGASEKQLKKKLGDKLCQIVTEAKETNEQEIKDKLSELNIGYLTLDDKNYPALLKEIPDCPAVIYIKGDIGALSRTSLALVGSRKYSNYGARVARKISKDLALSGVTVVSGLALGIDSAAHQATVELGGSTIGVLGCGLDCIYPTSNINLAKEMIIGGGAVITEYPPGTEPYKSNFPARNRIIAGMTLGTVVVEAAKSSGALITAMAALEYNREVFAVPGPIDSITSEGCNMLIQQGAKLIQTADDILQELNLEVRKSEQAAQEFLPETKEQKTIIDFISDTGKNADEIVRGCGYNVAITSYTLTILEMKGILENVSGLWKRKI